MHTTFFSHPLLALIARQRSRRRQARATFAALDALDTRLLRDIGLDRSELPSVAAALAGRVEPDRVLVANSLSDRSR